MRRLSPSTLSPSALAPHRIQQALTLLGVERGIIYAADSKRGNMSRPLSFWVRHERDLPGLLKDFQSAYKRAIKRAHTDRGGSHEAAVLVNLSWALVKRLFAQRGVRLD